MHFFRQVSIHSVWLGNNITPLREEEWGEDEEDEADTPAPTSPPISPINSRSATKKCSYVLSHISSVSTQVMLCILVLIQTLSLCLFQEASCRC